MIIKTDCFLPCTDLRSMASTLEQLRECRAVKRINLLVTKEFATQNAVPDGCTMIVVDNISSSTAIQSIADNINCDYAMIYTKATPLTIGLYALRRILRVASETGAEMVYSDHYSVIDGTTVPHPVIDYQEGSLRDDFDFGSVLLFNSKTIKEYATKYSEADYKYAALYDLRLFASRRGQIFHLNEFLYTEEEKDTRDSGEKQFDYVNPRNREVQVEMEKAVTTHLKEIGAFIDTADYETPDFGEQAFNCEASVIIPVKNREKTICDAVDSALAQKTRFKFNVIVVDNHSTDDTTKLLEAYAKKKDNGNKPRLIHIIPERTDLGIGGCWNVAVNDSRCGKFAVQLDSDDLYSSENTLQTIVDEFHKQHAAMIIGSYRMCDFNLNTLPPGLIDHAEWTDDNGCNNALRINGLGAPRAFFTPLLRQLQFPNTSYGEDYAMALAFCRRYKIGRIFNELYLCRRWGGNSDAALSLEKVNANNLYKDRLRTIEIAARKQLSKGQIDLSDDNSLYRFFNRQLEQWDEARTHFRDLHNVEQRPLNTDNGTLLVQFNPARIVSTGAKIDKKSIEKRPCFLCRKNRPEQQMAKYIDKDFELLVNPFPILPMHFTIPMRNHQPQAIYHNYCEMHRLLTSFPNLMIFYNGPKCGASAPDHCHFQAGTSGILPLQTGWQRYCRSLTEIYANSAGETISTIDDYASPALLIRSHSTKGDAELFKYVYKALPMQKDDTEPMMNLVAWRSGDEFLTVLFPRRKHRPDCYPDTSADCQSDDSLMVSPGALDMAGMIITPRKADFDNITPEKAVSILREVSLGNEEFAEVINKIKDNANKPSAISMICHKRHEPNVHVGIVSAERIEFSLNGDYSAKGETITGRQTVEFSEGGILWNGNQYRELCFQPKSDKASFSLFDVTIGVNFHWERKETQKFQGELRLVVEADKICAINSLPVEKYLESVISSEMSATSSIELLKAHAVISRSWLLAQMKKRKDVAETGNNFFSFIKKDDMLIRWYDREDHTIFDVCADDHCQRYQGITKETSPHVAEAIRQTRGQILMNDGDICDARFSKCCGGVSEEFQYCWENLSKPYLVAVRDNSSGMLSAGDFPDLTIEENADKWIRSCPESFCNTNDRKVLAQVLNDYDQETADFYRWHVTLSQEKLKQLFKEKLKMDFGDILDLKAVERGRSGRISRLLIIGSKQSFTIGKELEIRRSLSDSHLYSSAFVVDKADINENGVPQRFLLTGAGWGHGVGLCQIGAAMMGEQGFNYQQILLHYYRNAEIKGIY